MKLACRYSIIQFTPHIETGEFANIGVALTCPKTGYFNFVLRESRSKRITDFFSGVDRPYYLNAVRAVSLELTRIKSVIKEGPSTSSPEVLRNLFSNLTKPRESILRFGEERVILTDEPGKELTRLYDFYVEHTFLTKEYVEKIMNERLKGLLAGLDLAEPFRAKRLGDEALNARFEYVQTIDGKDTKVIKALNLSHDDPNDIFAHGDVWTGKLSRLRRFGHLPEKVLITVATNEADKANRLAAKEIIDRLKDQNVIVVSNGQKKESINAITEFAIS